MEVPCLCPLGRAVAEPLPELRRLPLVGRGACAPFGLMRGLAVPGASYHETVGRTKPDTQRVEGKTAERKAAFLEAMATHVTVLASCKAAGVGRSTVYQWRDEDPEFAEAFREVDDANVERAEQVLYELAVTGHERREYDKDGNLLSEHTVRDPQLLQFLLKARRPNVYRDRATVEHTGPDGGPVKVEQTHDLSKLSADELRDLHGLLSKANAPE